MPGLPLAGIILCRPTVIPDENHAVTGIAVVRDGLDPEEVPQ